VWKLNWFLRDFGYDTELLGRDKLDETQLVGLKGVVKISHIVINNASLIRLDGFAPACRWEELSTVVPRRNSDGQWVSDSIRRIRRARWLPHGLKQKRVDHPV
jgi:hypothetical protein